MAAASIAAAIMSCMVHMAGCALATTLKFQCALLQTPLGCRRILRIAGYRAARSDQDGPDLMARCTRKSHKSLLLCYPMYWLPASIVPMTKICCWLTPSEPLAHTMPEPNASSMVLAKQARAGGGRRDAAGAPVGVHVRRPEHRLRGGARLPVRGGAPAGVAPGAPCPRKVTWPVWWRLSTASSGMEALLALRADVVFSCS